MSLRFPETLGSPDTPAYIRFTPEKVEYGGINGLNSIGRTPNPANAIGKAIGKASSGGGGLLDNLKGRLKDRVESTVGGIVDNFVNDAIGTVQSKVNDALGNFSGAVDVRGIIGTLTTPAGSGGSINLFLPESMSTNQGVGYREGGGLLSTTLAGAVGSKAMSLADAMQAVGENAKPLIKEAGVNVINSLTDGAGSDIRAMTEGKVSNNFSFMFFETVGHRKFTYTFEMVPTSAREAGAVQSIVDEFIYNMLPKREEGDYIIPPQWNIEYVGVKMLQPKKCFLEDVSVSYNDGAGKAVHADEHPFKTTMALSFIEIEPLYAKSEE